MSPLGKLAAACHTSENNVEVIWGKIPSPFVFDRIWFEQQWKPREGFNYDQIEMRLFAFMGIDVHNLKELSQLYTGRMDCTRPNKSNEPKAQWPKCGYV